MNESQGSTAPAGPSAPQDGAPRRTKLARDVADLLAAIVQSSEDGIYSKNDQAQITSWNPAAERLYGYSAEEAIGQPVSILIPPDKKGEELDILNRILKGERVDYYETHRVTKAGTIVEVSITVSPVRNANGEIVEASVIARDIGPLKEAQNAMARVREAEAGREAVQEFLAMTAHDLKGPLSVIAGMAQILKDNWSGLEDDKKMQLIDALERNALRMTNLVDDLLLLARAEAHQIRPQKELVRLEGFLVELISEHGTDIGLTGVGGGPAIEADRRHLHRILTNYLTNAQKYGGPPITLEVKAAEEIVTICVVDSGEGIPDEFVPELFAKFTRGPSAAGSSGSGLGLAIAKSLAEANDGDAFHEPNAPSGSRFCVRLPTGRPG